EWAAYQRLLQAGRSPLDGREQLDAAAIELEELYLGLRTSDGLEANRLPAALSRAWAAQGWAAQTEGRIQLTSEGWLRLDALVPAIAG
ncbi:MAG: oxygen-independent coproporphyrinogen oxidase, partial [Geminicoccaceae bacterium]|nr:oxygen-independent coproporphyrinogen oxidase [Geminicoccaceae bacterium]